MNLKIIVATHKKYWMPDSDIYLPVYVGAEGKSDTDNFLRLGYTRDNIGDNISAKNKNYCELTALYWAWKNLDADYTGLCHYRRYFRGALTSDKKKMVAKRDDLETVLNSYDLILPVKRNYFIETNYSQYAHAHHRIDLDTTRKIIEERYPEYIPAYDRSMKKTSGHRFNMMVARRDIFDSYCRWLFDILFELENRLDISDYSDNDKRVFGFVSERLLDIWVETNNIQYKELPVVNLENQHWIKKIFNFLKRKVKGLI